MSVHPWNRGLWHDLTQNRGRLPHALLLQGPRGVGKREFALALGQWLLCAAPGPEGACGQCSSCGWFAQGGHPDFRLIEPRAESEDEPGKKGGKSITIGDIRELGDFLGLASHQGGWRVVVVHPAEALNPAAGNALLKTLEEPPANVLLILVTHQPRRLLPTILSRCRKLIFPLPDKSTARDWLVAEGQADAVAVLDEAGGAPLQAIDGADPGRLERRQRFLDALSEPNPGALSALAQEFQQRPGEGWGWFSRWLYDLLAVQASGVPRYFPERADALHSLAKRLGQSSLWQLQQTLAQTGRWLNHPLNGQLLLESWLLGYLDSLEGRRGR